MGLDWIVGSLSSHLCIDLFVPEVVDGASSTSEEHCAAAEQSQEAKVREAASWRCKGDGPGGKCDMEVYQVLRQSAERWRAEVGTARWPHEIHRYDM